MGKGRPKGYSPYAEITYEELGDWIGRKTMVKVSRAWLDSLRGSPVPSSPPVESDDLLSATTKEEILPKIEYTLTDL